MEQPERVGNFNIWARDTTSEAREIALDMASSMDAESIPVTVYRQGQRYQAVGAIRFGLVARTLYSESARKGASLDNIVSATNRPKDSGHISDIAEYVKGNLNNKYVFGALTLNASQELNMIIVGRSGIADIRQGYLILPRSAKVSITDGQHRQEAITRIINDDTLPAAIREELARQAVAVIITNETELDQIHQDFADASKAKMLPPSLLAMFDTRNPANRLIPLLERNCPLFRGRIEPASKTAGKNSIKLYTANQIRSFLKEFLTGSWQLADEEFENRAHRLLSNDEKFEHEMSKAVAYINRVTETVPVLSELAQLDVEAPVSRVAAIRDNLDAGGGYVCVSATGLVILGRIGNELFRKHSSNWQVFADRLGDVSWEKSASLWQDNVVVQHTIKRKGKPDEIGLRILQSANPISRAADLVRIQIGLETVEPGASDAQITSDELTFATA
jgi:DNA sulfur modification protein DndB